MTGDGELPPPYIQQFLAEYADLTPLEQREARARIAALGARCSLHGVTLEAGACWLCARSTDEDGLVG